MFTDIARETTRVFINDVGLVAAPHATDILRPRAFTALSPGTR